jgi:hypothetical protein
MSRPSASTPLNADPRAVTPDTTKITRYRTIDVDGLKLFYREAGASEAPALLLLHGFPTSSHMYRDLIPALADRYHVVAPDLPGFGFTEAPDRKRFKYSFEHLADVIERFTEAVGLSQYALYVFDLRRTNWISPSHSPSGADHRCDLAERQRLPAGFERRLESYSGLLERTVIGESRRTARFPQA